MTSNDSPTMMIRLHPVSGTEMSGFGGTELLRMECTERPDLDLQYKAPAGEVATSSCSQVKNEQQQQHKPNTISLGRNLLTMIADPTLPSNAVDVVVELCDDDDDNKTTTNDNTILENGFRDDAIRLLSDPSTFSFEQAPSNNFSTSDSSSSHNEIRKQPKLRLRIQRYIAGFVAINNETVSKPNAIIMEGDILSLQSMSYSYDYVLLLTSLSDLSDNSSKPHTSTGTETNILPLPVLPPPSNNNDCVTTTNDAVVTTNQQQQYVELIEQQQKLMQQMVNDEFTCAICLEYQVLSTALVPCGHSFCNACIFDKTKKKLKHKLCSVCNTKVTSVVPNRTIDSCFQLMAQFQNEQLKKQVNVDDELLIVSILQQEDLDHYKERTNEKKNVRMSPESNRRQKRHRTTNNATHPLPPIPPPGPTAQLQLLEFPDIGWLGEETLDGDNDADNLLPFNVMFHANQSFPGMPAVLGHVGTMILPTIRGTTPTDAIEID